MSKLSSTTKIFLVACLGVAMTISLAALVHHGAKAVPSHQKKRVTAKRMLEEKDATPAPTGPYGTPVKLADLKDPAVRESSGLIASRNNPGLYWTNNDSGDGPFIYAFDRSGERRGVWRVAGAKARDWEALAEGHGPQAGRPYLYAGDIGDNNERRSEIVIYRFPEPTISANDVVSTKSEPRLTEPAEIIRLKYPDGKHDSETLMVHPVSGNLYVVSKIALANPHVYEAAPPFSTTEPIQLRHVAELRIPSMFGGIITDGSISPDGTRVALCDYLQGYEFVLEKGESDFDTIWKQPLKTIGLGSRPQGEAIAYSPDGRALLVTSEGWPSPFIEIGRR
jgi:hypothetical protein